MEFFHSPYSKDLGKTISLINYSKMVVAPDSSLIHISAGLDVPVLGVYGAFSGDIRMSTYKYADWVVPPENYDVCEAGGRFCFKHGHAPCKAAPVGKCVPCYDHIELDVAYQKMNRLMKLKQIDGEEESSLIGEDSSTSLEIREE